MSLNNLKKLERFQCIKHKGAKLNWISAIFDPAESYMPRTVINERMIYPHGQESQCGNFCFFPGTCLHFSAKLYKVAFSAHFKNIFEEEEGTGTGLACLQS